MRAYLSALVAAAAAAGLSTAVSSAAAQGEEPVKIDRVVAVAESEGVRVLLYSDTGPCVGAARLAEHIARSGEKTPGCWIVYQGSVMVSFLDGERGTIPMTQLRRPTDS